MEKLTLTRKEAAAILGISTVTQWAKNERVRAIKISDKEKSRYLFTHEDCIAALNYERTALAPLCPFVSRLNYTIDKIHN